MSRKEQLTEQLNETVDTYVKYIDVDTGNTVRKLLLRMYIKGISLHSIIVHAFSSYKKLCKILNLCIWEQPHMTSDEFGQFLTYLPTQIR